MILSVLAKFLVRYGYICPFSLLAPKENRRKEMRFAALRLRSRAIFLEVLISLHSPRRGDILLTPYKAARSDAAVWGRAWPRAPPAARAAVTEEQQG